jgi:tetratricopeptide (TPR) repeat protein
MEEGLFHNPMFVNHINESAVAVVGHSEGHTEESRRNPMTGADEKVCPHYDTIPCEVHQKVYQDTRSSFDFRGVPACFIALPSGEKFAEVNGQAPQAFIDKLNEAQQKIGQRPILGSQIARWMAGLYDGDRKAAQGKYKDAAAAYKKVADDEKIPQFVRARATERGTALAAKITAAIDEAKAKPPAKAKGELKKLIGQLKDFPEAKAAAEAALAELEGK